LSELPERTLEAPVEPVVAPTLYGGAWSPRRDYGRAVRDEYTQPEPDEAYSQETAVSESRAPGVRMPSSNAPAGARDNLYEIGMRIRHDRFGTESCARSKARASKRVTVIFDAGSERKFLVHRAHASVVTARENRMSNKIDRNLFTTSSAPGIDFRPLKST
jgi:hypothetical protein